MKKSITLTVLTLIIFIAFACNAGSPKAGNKEIPDQETALVYYTCPMHPEVHSDIPGKCPICGMDLVKTSMIMSDSAMTK